MSQRKRLIIGQPVRSHCNHFVRCSWCMVWCGTMSTQVKVFIKVSIDGVYTLDLKNGKEITNNSGTFRLSGLNRCLVWNCCGGGSRLCLVFWMPPSAFADLFILVAVNISAQLCAVPVLSMFRRCDGMLQSCRCYHWRSRLACGGRGVVQCIASRHGTRTTRQKTRLASWSRAR